MRTIVVVALSCAAGVGCTCGTKSERSGEGEVGSAAYFVDMGVLHERYGDQASALSYFTKALRLARSAGERIQAHLGAARIEEARGNTGAAIESLEAAMAGQDGLPSGAPAPSVTLAARGTDDDIVARLGRLYIAVGRVQDAEQLYQRSLGHARDYWQQDSVQRLLIELWNKMGSLAQHVAEKESLLQGKDVVEKDLRFLALAYTGSGAGIGFITPAWAGGDPKGPQVDKLVRVYERLYKIHHGDAQMRQAIITLYERQGKVDEAIRLLREPNAPEPAVVLLADRAPGGEQISCKVGVVPRPLPEAVAREAEVVRVLLRAGRRQEALTEAAKLVALGRDKRVGVPAFTVGAHLYLEQNRPDISAKAIADGARTWRSPADRRELAVAQADVLLQSGKLRELKALLDQWKRSDNACLRTEASRREALIGQKTASPSGSSG